MIGLRKINVFVTCILLIFSSFVYKNDVVAEQADEYLSAFNQSTTIDDITVSVVADEGVFPEGSTLSVEKVSNQKEVDQALDEVRESNSNVVETFSFDIKVLDNDNNEIQPNGTVRVSFAYKNNTNDNLNTNVYHVDENLNAEKLDVDINDETAVVETDSFSIYTVEFTYDSKQYVLNGDESVKLRDILDFVGLSGNIESAETSNSNLVSVELTDGEWIVYSKAPFTSNEWLKVVLDGVEYEIELTDYIAQGWFGGGSADLFWQITDENKLIIRPKDSLGGASGSGAIKANFDSESSWPWHNYRSRIKEVEFQGNVYIEGSRSIRNMFSNMTNLEKVNVQKFNTDNANNMRGMFQNCTKIKELDLSTFTNSGKLTDIAYMFDNCSSLEKVILNNKKFVTRISADSTNASNYPEEALNNTGNKNGCQSQNMFRDCRNLKEVDMSNITIGGWRSDLCNNFGGSEDGQYSGLFQNLSNLEKVNMSNIKLPGMLNLRRMFNNCTNLKIVNMSGNVDVADVEDMYGMFMNSFTIASGENNNTLDISGFGKLQKIVTMANFVSGCSQLNILNISNLDNSMINPRNDYHSCADDDTGCLTYNSYGRNYSINDTSTSNLHTIFANNSKVWMVNNTKGNPGQEYFNASSESDILYFTKKQIEFKSDVGPTVNIIDKRDYVDLLTDRNEDGIRGNGNNEIDTNINTKDGHLNTNGAGFLAPGVYHIDREKDWEDTHPEPVDTFYRITEMNSAVRTVEINNSLGGVLVKNGDYVVNTSEQSRDFWNSDGNDKVLGDGKNTLITITYENVATDIYGNKHDVIVEVKKITFKDVNLIPEYINGTTVIRDHDSNKIAGNTYYRQILEAADDRLIFNNYVRTAKPYPLSYYVQDSQVLSNGSGTYIDFDIKVKDALDDTSLLFYIDDLDVPHAQNWVRDDEDACFDRLDWENVEYGEGSEGIVLGVGNDLDTLSFADHTGLEVTNYNRVLATGSDPKTSWSEFYVRANSQGASYTWTSGVACTTDFLKNTKSPEKPLPVYVFPEAIKYVNESEPKGDYANKFTFYLKPSSETPQNYGEHTDISGLTNKASASDNQEKKNSGKYVVFDELVLPVPEDDNPVLYMYEITEKDENTTGDIIKYDKDTKYYMQIVVYRPINDIEMFRGTRAEIIIGKKVGDSEIVWDKTNVITVYANDAQPVDGKTGPDNEKVFADAQGIEFYRKEGKYYRQSDNTELEPDRHATVDRYIEYNGVSYPVKIDKNGVEYFKDNDGKYRNPNDPDRELISAREGDIDPDTTINDSPVIVAKTVNGNTVKEDVHGIEYYGEYYDLSGSTLTVKDGEFNPNVNDKVVYINKTVDGKTLYMHSNGVIYYKDGDDFYGEDGTKLTPKSDGDVDPLPSDSSAQDNEIVTKNLRESVTGNGYKVYLETNGIEYYFDIEKQTYHTRYGTLLIPGFGSFEPAATDEIITVSREIWIDSNGTRFYKNEGNYYKESDDSLYELSEGTLDTSEIVDVGSFNNIVKTSDITIIKETTDNKAGNFKVNVQFDNEFKPKYVTYSPIGSNEEFKLIDAENNIWQFILEDGQQLTIREVPYYTTYTITEPVDENGWELVSIKDKDDIVNNSKIINTQKGDSDLYNKNYEHTITNRFTEFLVNKVVEKGSETRSFKFKATLSGLTPDKEYTYGWINETEQQYYNNKADSTGNISYEFNLKHNEDIALVIPYGSNLVVEENAPSAYTVTNTKGSGNKTNTISINDDKLDVKFTNSSDKATLKVNWDDEGNEYSSRPDDLEGFISYVKDGVTVTINTKDDPDNTWIKNGNVWEYVFEVPSGITVSEFGQSNTPNHYTHDSSEDTKDTDNKIFGITNHLKTEDFVERKTITRTINFTEYEVGGTIVFEPVVQSVTLKRTITYDPVSGEKIYSDWQIESGDYGPINVPTKPGWSSNMGTVPAWSIDLKNPDVTDEVVNVIYTPRVVPPTPYNPPKTGD